MHPGDGVKRMTTRGAVYSDLFVQNVYIDYLYKEETQSMIHLLFEIQNDC